MPDFLISPSIFYSYIMPNMTKSRAYKWLGILDIMKRAVQTQLILVHDARWARNWSYPSDKLKTQEKNLTYMENSINYWLENGHHTSLN